MNRVIFVNRYFAPDHSATSQILSDLAFHLASAGREVHVIAGDQLYDDPGARLKRQESLRGVGVTRVSSTRFGRGGLFGRAIDYLGLYISLSRAALRLARPGDVLVAKTDPPLISVMMAKVARRRGAHLINWLQDLYPEVAIHLGVPLMRGPIIRAIMYFRDRSLLAAAANVTLGDLMAERVKKRGVQASLIRVVHNWVDEQQIRPVSYSSNPLRKAWGLEGKFVVGYSGNLGRAHEYETLLDAAKRLRQRQDIIFLFIGGGGRTEKLKRAVAQHGLSDSFMFQPYQDRERLDVSLSLPDVHWISLRPELEGMIVPSKVYGAMAAGRPIVAITAHDGELARIVRKADCGAVIQPGQGAALATALSHLASNPDQCQAMGARARQTLEARFSRSRAFRQWEQLLESIRERN